MPPAPVFALTPTVQQYDWGKRGDASKVARLAAVAHAVSIDATAPYAEVRSLSRPLPFSGG